MFLRFGKYFKWKQWKSHNLYLRWDVLLLADISEKIRNDSLKNYGLCLSHYLSAPAFSYGAMLNMTTVEHEFISDGDMYLFFEKVMRDKVFMSPKDIVKPTINI